MKLFVFMILGLLSLNAFAKNPLRFIKLPNIIFTGEGGGWDPSIMRCQTNFKDISEEIQFQDDDKFLRFVGRCTNDSSDPEYPSSIFFASLMLSQIKTNMDPGLYTSSAFCLVRNSSTSKIVDLLSNDDVDFMLIEDNSQSCKNGNYSSYRLNVILH